MTLSPGVDLSIRTVRGAIVELVMKVLMSLSLKEDGEDVKTIEVGSRITPSSCLFSHLSRLDHFPAGYPFVMLRKAYTLNATFPKVFSQHELSNL